MKKIIDDDLQKEIIEELNKRDTNIVEALRTSGALDWIYSKMEEPEDKELVNAQINEMAKEMQPAVDFIYKSLKVPGIAEEFYKTLMPELKDIKPQKKSSEK